MMGPYSVMKIWALWQLYPDEIKVIHNTMVRPHWRETHYLFHTYFDWSNHWNIHLNARFVPEMLRRYNNTFEKIRDIDCLESTFGEVIRSVVYGSRDRCSGN